MKNFIWEVTANPGISIGVQAPNVFAAVRVAIVNGIPMESIESVVLKFEWNGKYEFTKSEDSAPQRLEAA